MEHGHFPAPCRCSTRILADRRHMLSHKVTLPGVCHASCISRWGKPTPPPISGSNLRLSKRPHVSPQCPYNLHSTIIFYPLLWPIQRSQCYYTSRRRYHKDYCFHDPRSVLCSLLLANHVSNIFPSACSGGCPIALTVFAKPSGNTLAVYARQGVDHEPHR